MLLNLSNHPFADWSDQQKQAAQLQFGEVRDIPFPHIDPQADYDQVGQLAEKYLREIVLLPPATVHLMGELTFCYMLAQLLQAAGIACVASTTQRIVTLENEVKKVTFTFETFRRYY